MKTIQKMLIALLLITVSSVAYATGKNNSPRRLHTIGGHFSKKKRPRGTHAKGPHPTSFKKNRSSKKRFNVDGDKGRTGKIDYFDQFR